MRWWKNNDRELSHGVMLAVVRGPVELSWRSDEANKGNNRNTGNGLLGNWRANHECSDTSSGTLFVGANGRQWSVQRGFS